jgi:spermidine synthase
MNKVFYLIPFLFTYLLVKSNNKNDKNNICATKYKISNDEIYYPTLDSSDDYEMSRFNYKTKRVTHPYAKFIMRQINETHKKVLVLGVALGGIIINILDKYPNTKVVGVDITNECFDLVHKFSNNNRLRLIKDDAETYINNTNERFDVIICDIFNDDTSDDNIPEFVLKQKFLDNIKRMISFNGKFIINSLNEKKFNRRILYKLSTTFNKVKKYVTEEGGNKVYVTY